MRIRDVYPQDNPVASQQAGAPPALGVAQGALCVRSPSYLCGSGGQGWTGTHGYHDACVPRGRYPWSRKDTVMWSYLRGVLVLGWMAVSVGCAPALRHPDVSLTAYDRDTGYRVTPQDTGFTLAVYYSRYQVMPEQSAVATVCQSAAQTLAYAEAQKQGKKIRPLTEHQIRLSLDRNEITGLTSCSARVTAEWEQ
jgi:hypothetical protein